MFHTKCPSCGEKVPALDRAVELVKLLRAIETDEWASRCCQNAYAFASEELALLLGERGTTH